MKSLISFFAALLFGAGAAGLNYLYLMENQTPTFAVIGIKGNAKIASGDSFPQESLEAIRVPLVPESGLSKEFYKKVFVEWEDRILLWGLKANRDLAGQEPLLFSDLKAMIAQKNGRYSLLKFRVLAAGDKIKTPKAIDSALGSAAGMASTHVTIAVSDPDIPLPSNASQAASKKLEDSRRIIQYVLIQGSKSKSTNDSILGVSVYPKEVKGPEVEESFARPGVGEMALTVPLQGIPSVPSVILIGGDIGFFMPGSN